jgi:hypothetical protein
VLGAESAKIVEGHLSARWPDEFGLAQLTPRDGSRTYAAPSGVVLNATYIDFLRRALPPAQIRLRMKGDYEPVVILAGGTPIGIVMPVKR